MKIMGIKRGNKDDVSLNVSIFANAKLMLKC